MLGRPIGRPLGRPRIRRPIGRPIRRPIGRPRETAYGRGREVPPFASRKMIENPLYATLLGETSARETYRETNRETAYGRGRELPRFAKRSGTTRETTGDPKKNKKNVLGRPIGRLLGRPIGRPAWLRPCRGHFIAFAEISFNILTVGRMIFFKN